MIHGDKSTETFQPSPQFPVVPFCIFQLIVLASCCSRAADRRLAAG